MLCAAPSEDSDMSELPYREMPRWVGWLRYPPDRPYPVLKRILDLGTISVTAPAWLPLLLILSILVRWRLGTPVLFRQRRPGLKARIFQLVKFRTMLDLRDTEGRQLPDALRLTPFGKWMRASSLDELPEILCILTGEMSLVGPRPLLEQYLSRYSPEQAKRHDRPPGLTGLAQVLGRNHLDWEQKFLMDGWYVRHASVGLDLWILWRTVVVVLNRRGISAPGEATMGEFLGRPNIQM